jgi:hypothetical protein
MKKTLLTFLIVLFAIRIFSQASVPGIITGIVTDKNTKQPMPGCTIVILNSNHGVTTDSMGVFSISTLSEGLYNLQFSFIGYQTQIVNDIRVSPNKKSYVKIEIQEESTRVSGVEVSAFRFENNPLAPISTYALSKEEIFLSPGSQSDVLRAIGMLPGVQSSGGEFSAIAVRGQGIHDNVYQIDGIPVYSLGHFEGNNTGFNDPNGGRFSILPPRAVQSAEFCAGGFSCEYGRRNSAYLGIELSEGNPQCYHVEGQIDLMGGMVNYQGPSYFHNNTSLFVSMRYQNFQKVFSLTNMLSDGVPQYGDFIAKSTTKIGVKNQLSFIAVSNHNAFNKDVKHLLMQEEILEDHLADSKEHKNVLGVNLRTLTSSNSFWKNILYYRQYRKNYLIGKAYLFENEEGGMPDEKEVGVDRNVLDRKKNDTEIGYRSVFTYNFQNHSRLLCGVDFFNLQLDYSRYLSQVDTVYDFSSIDYRADTSQKYIVLQPGHINSRYNENANNVASYIQYSFPIYNRLYLNAGLRYDYYGFTNTHSISPRVSGNIKLSEKNSINFAAGIYYQDVLPENISDSENPGELKNERSVHCILGYKKYFTPTLKFTAEVYYKGFSNLMVRKSNVTKEYTNEGTGHSYGADFSLIKRLTNKIGGQVSYSYMQSKRNDNIGQGEYDYIYSMPHIFSSYLRYTISERWIVAAKFRYFTGKPCNEYIIHENVHQEEPLLRYSKESVTINTDRLDDYLSFDLRADYRVQFASFAFIAFVDIANVTDRLNPNYIVFQERSGEIVPKGVKMFPTFGLKFEL